MRTCSKCAAAENPLGKLRFRKNRIDGEIYCENCDPQRGEEATPVSAPSPSRERASAGSLVIIPCPVCRGMTHKPHGRPCEGCAGYGSVRVPENHLVVFKFPKDPEPEVLTEG